MHDRLLHIKPGMKGTAERSRRRAHFAPRRPGKIRVLATPVMINLIEAKIKASAVVTRVEGRNIYFDVSAEDEKEPIGGGTHERVIVNVERFDKRVQRKISGE
jgi:predicted thioesterase